MTPEEILLEHSQNPRGRGEVATETVQRICENTRCGDRFLISVVSTPVASCQSLSVTNSASALKIVWDGRGCAASTVSMSLLASFVATLGQTQKVDIDTFRWTIEGAYWLLRRALEKREMLGQDDLLALGDAAALVSYASYPLKVGCALLPWRCLVELVCAPSFKLC